HVPQEGGMSKIALLYVLGRTVGCKRRPGGVHSLREHGMFERLADFWDIVIFGFVLLMLASLQLRHASYAEGLLALAAIVFGVGLLLAKKWALIGTYITLLLGLVVYFAQIWFEPIMTSQG